MATTTPWRILVVDDQQADDIAEYIESRLQLPNNGEVYTDTVTRIRDAISRIEGSRWDLVVLDLRDDSSEMDDSEMLAGEWVFDQVKVLRFVPIVFYTALPNRISFEPNPCVRVVERGDLKNLVEAIQGVIDTGIVDLTRHIEDEVRDYMWNTVIEHGEEFVGSAVTGEDGRSADVVYLVYRRLAAMLRQESARRLVKRQGTDTPSPEDNDRVNAVEMYIYPVVGDRKLRSGQIYRRLVSQGGDEHWIVITPSCDFAQRKVRCALLARAVDIGHEDEVERAKAAHQKNGRLGNEMRNRLVNLMKGKKESQYYLPGTFFLTQDLLVDFQTLKQEDLVEVDGELSLPEEYKVVAALDTPFSESLVHKFGRYYGRIGTPDLDYDAAIARLGFGVCDGR